MAESFDTLLGGKVRVCSCVRGAKATGDSVLLASAVDRKIAPRGARVLEVGTASGAVAMCVLARLPDLRVTGIDIQSAEVARAEKTAAANPCGKGFTALQEDILRPSAELKRQVFDLVITNPPYHRGRKSEDSSRATARSESAPVAEWIAACAKRLGNFGSLVLIHDAARVAEICAALTAAKLGAVEIFPISSRANGPALRVIVRAKKGSAAGAKLFPPLVMHHGGAFSAAARRLLEDGEALTAVLERPI